VIKFIISQGLRQLECELNSTPNRKAPIRFKGDNQLQIEFVTWLKSQSGAFGHTLNENITPIDLIYVLEKARVKIFEIKIIEGESTIKVFDPDIPENTVT
jgi:hypothetical protein